MLGILLIYFIGKRFYDLAEEHNQNKWLFSILAVVIYYVSGVILIGGIILLDVYVFDWRFDWESNYGINLLSIPLGLLCVWLFYMLLENRWKKSVVVVKDEISDIGKNTED